VDEVFGKHRLDKTQGRNGDHVTLTVTTLQVDGVVGDEPPPQYSLFTIVSKLGAVEHAWPVIVAR
jgi:hypothetical protein